MNILLIGPLGLVDHDVYVCFDFKDPTLTLALALTLALYCFKDPFSYFQPGYFGDKHPVAGSLTFHLLVK